MLGLGAPLHLASGGGDVGQVGGQVLQLLQAKRVQSGALQGDQLAGAAVSARQQLRPPCTKRAGPGQVDTRVTTIASVAACLVSLGSCLIAGLRHQQMVALILALTWALT